MPRNEQQVYSSKIVRQACVKTLYSLLVFWIIHSLPLSFITMEPVVVGSILPPYSALYGVLAAFIMFVVWSQFYQTESAIYREASCLGDMIRLAKQLEDANARESIIKQVKKYAQQVAMNEWERDAKTQEGENELFKIHQCIRSIEFKDERDARIFGKLLDFFDNVSASRDERLSYGNTKIPKTLWLLLSLSSWGFLIFFFLLPSSFAAYLAVAVTGIVVHLLLGVVFDLDNPFEGIWNLSAVSFEDVYKK